MLEAPFTAALDIAAATYPWVPTSLLMRDPFLSRENILRVDEPLLIVHGTDDRLFRSSMGRRLFELAHEPKKLAIIDGATHSDLWDHGLWPIVLGFLGREGVTCRAVTPAWLRPSPSSAACLRAPARSSG